MAAISANLKIESWRESDLGRMLPRITAPRGSDMESDVATIDPGTTAPVLVTISGNTGSGAGNAIFIYEQTAAGLLTIDPQGAGSITNAILVGTSPLTGNTDAGGDNFTDIVVLNGFTSYTLGATGAAGDIFFVTSGNNVITPTS